MSDRYKDYGLILKPSELDITYGRGITQLDQLDQIVSGIGIYALRNRFNYFYMGLGNQPYIDPLFKVDGQGSYFKGDKLLTEKDLKHIKIPTRVIKPSVSQMQMDGRIKDNKDAIILLKGRTKKLENELATQEKTNNEKFKVVQNNIDKNKGEIDGLRKDVDYNKQSISDLQKLINANKHLLDNSVTDLQGKLDSVHNSYDNLHGDVNTNQDIVSTKIQELDDELAKAKALSKKLQSIIDAGRLSTDSVHQEIVDVSSQGKGDIDTELQKYRGFLNNMQKEINELKKSGGGSSAPCPPSSGGGESMGRNEIFKIMQDYFLDDTQDKHFIGRFTVEGIADFQQKIFGDSAGFKGEVECSHLKVNGDKACVQQTKNFGRVLVNAYETAEYYFGDIGFAQTDETRKIKIEIEEVFKETVRTDLPYHIFISKYDFGDFRIIEQNKDYFILESEKPNFKFSWEIKAKRFGHENVRLKDAGESMLK